MHSVEDTHITTLLSSLVISLMTSIYDQMPPHAKKARALQDVITAVRAFSRLGAGKLDARLVDLGADIWNSCLTQMEEALLDFEATEEAGQASLFFVYNGVLRYPYE